MKNMLTILLALLFHSLAHGADRVRIGYPSAVGHFITMPLAEKKGFLKEKGIDAQIVQIRPLAAVPALGNGEIDYYAGVGPVVTAAIRGVPVRLVDPTKENGRFVPLIPAKCSVRISCQTMP